MRVFASGIYISSDIPSLLVPQKCNKQLKQRLLEGEQERVGAADTAVVTSRAWTLQQLHPEFKGVRGELVSVGRVDTTPAASRTRDEES